VLQISADDNDNDSNKASRRVLLASEKVNQT
jgi:hypothetical protein